MAEENNHVSKNEMDEHESKQLQINFLTTGNTTRNKELSQTESTKLQQTNNDPQASAVERYIKRHRNDSLNMDKTTETVGRFIPNSHSKRNRKRNSNNYRSTSICRSAQRERVSSSVSNVSVHMEGRQSKTPFRSHHIDFRKLVELYDNNKPYDILLALNDKEGGFEELLKSNDLSPNLIVLILQVLSKVCKTTLEMKTKILLLFCHYFVEQHFIKYILNLPLQSRNEKLKNDFFWDDINEFWKNAFILLNDVILISPNTALEKFPKLINAIEMTITQLQKNNVIINKEILDEMDNISKALIVVKSNEDKRKIKKMLTQENIDQPSDDYRTICLFPESKEITENMQPYLRPNIVDGAYNDIDHYLDIQCRLFREDFVRPLRVGINEWINQPINEKRKRIENIKIYEGVTFEKSKIRTHNSGLLINLNLSHNNKKNLERIEFSNRFIFGSLLVFTNDLFKTFFFATVSNRDMSILRKGTIAVELKNILADDVFDKKFVMVESETYFEPYYHGLRALQCISEYNFPMKKYIVDVETQNKLPRYLEINPNLKIGSYQVNLLLNNWPTADQLNLDSSQHRALKFALTNEFSIIQGPPGTGKTFLGLQIVKILLNNRFWFNNSGSMHNPLWINASEDQYNQLDDYEYQQDLFWRKYFENKICLGKPMLIVCYTNHALDQFLEEIIKITDQVIRVGGQSKNKNLKAYNIKEKRVPFRRNKPDNKRIGSTLYKIMKEKLDVINNINYQIEFLHNNNYIFDISQYFRNVNESNWFTRANEYQLLDWLFPVENQCSLHIEIRTQKILYSVISVYVRNLGREKKGFKVLYKLQEFNLEIKRLNDRIQNLEQIEDIGFGYNEEINELNEIRNSLINNLYYLQARLNTNVDISNFNLKEYDLNSPFVDCDARWAIYWYIIRQYENELLLELSKAEIKFNETSLALKQAQQIEDIEIMRNSLVVGMTTSCAAREQALIRELQPPIVIVEEAAEVSETHVLVSLTRHCKHLILIGDHKQLRPPVSVYKLAKDYHFDVSLFERMINNNIQYETLEVQHRMRPDIAKLIVPAIYPSLINHMSVLQYSDVLGITKNMYFVTHNVLENQTGNLLSKQNMHEADFLLALCCHLIMQGYRQDEITILATYNGQMFYMHKERNKYGPLLKDVRITVVDNFQGEENRIILLSLVRSNAQKKIGFLSVPNRICVALSRAREGFFMIGNMDILAEKSKLWQQIKNVLSEQNMIGPTLELRCQIHFDQLTQICSTTDFNVKSPEGGCRLPCGLLLNCGHSCNKICHTIDREHIEYKCHRKCTKVCNLNHPCQEDCYVDCPRCEVLVPIVLSCGHEHKKACHVDPEKYQCPTLIKVTLPLCKHEVQKPCSNDIDTFKCTIPCENRLPCGHQCTLKCHLDNDHDHLNYKCSKSCERFNTGCLSNHKCQKRCSEECDLCKKTEKKKRSQCNHVETVECNVDVDATPCTKPCKRKKSCGHECRRDCYVMCDQYVCKEKVRKVISPCNHYQKTLCGNVPDRKQCNGKCPLKLTCGHTCNNKCSKCVNGCDQTRCTGLVNNPFPAICGHTFKIPCRKLSIDKSSDYNSFVFQNNILKHCNFPCNTILKCGHKCNGTCGKCFQGRIHTNCTEDCGVTLTCGHSCEQACQENCLPCSKPCQYVCKHNKCNNKCGEPCVLCKEKCDWSCEHYACTKLCHEICDRPPCYEPCTKELKCGHQCIGLCGEPCPVECRVCDKEIVTEIFFGPDKEPDARFILLNDCKHIVEVTSLEQFLMMEPECKEEIRKIDSIVCPKCKKRINKTKRYSNIVKTTYFDIQNIKRKQFGTYNDIEIKKCQVMAKLVQLQESPVIGYVPGLLQLLNDMFKKLQPVKSHHKQLMSLVEIEALDNRIDITKDIITILTKVCSDYPPTKSAPLLIQTELIVQVLSKTIKISAQVHNDIDQEIDRLSKIRDLYVIENSPMYENNKTDTTVATIYNEVSRLIYTMDKVFSSDIKSEAEGLLIKLSTFLKTATPYRRCCFFFYREEE